MEIAERLLYQVYDITERLVLKEIKSQPVVQAQATPCMATKQDTDTWMEAATTYVHSSGAVRGSSAAGARPIGRRSRYSPAFWFKSGHPANTHLALSQVPGPKHGPKPCGCE
ncbi:hypothetical protein PLESTM_000580100 [Pleodorina starrii]|nr:hypothetical protein PLESTM_000580100 [Pleodorina starrii]